MHCDKREEVFNSSDLVIGVITVGRVHASQAGTGVPSFDNADSTFPFAESGAALALPDRAE